MGKNSKKIWIKLKSREGFSLVEVLVSMAIFVTFTSILINSYSSIVVAQRDANEYRLMYVEARHVFDTLVQEFRDGMIDYVKMQNMGFDLLRGQKDVYLVSKDAVTKTRIFQEGESVKVVKGKVNNPNENPVDTINTTLNSENVNISDFSVYVTPSIDPYDVQFVNYDVNQFHPKVTLFARFEMEGQGKKVYSIELQTSISSRIYNQVYLEELL